MLREERLHSLALSDACNDYILYEFTVGIQVLIRRQFLLTRNLLTLLGVACDIDNESQHLDIEFIGLVNRQNKTLLRSLQIIGLRLDVCIKALNDLQSQQSSAQHI